MKMTEQDIARIKKHWGDWETVHVVYDDLMEERLQSLDPEYVEELKKATEGASFWYA